MTKSFARRDWKRFVRVEQAIPRVRSDVAAHLFSPRTVNVTTHNPSILDDTRTQGNWTHDQVKGRVAER